MVGGRGLPAKTFPQLQEADFRKVEMEGAEFIYQEGEMMEKLARAADHWIEGGKPKERFLTGKAFYIAQCWQNGARASEKDSEHFDPVINQFIAACREHIGGDEGWRTMLEEKTSCAACSATYRYENISVCTRCLGFFCYECIGGHRSCPGAIVG